MSSIACTTASLSAAYESSQLHRQARAAVESCNEKRHVKSHAHLPANLCLGNCDVGLALLRVI